MVMYKLKVYDYEDSFTACFITNEKNKDEILDLIELAIKKAGNKFRFSLDYRQFDKKKDKILDMKVNDTFNLMIGSDYGDDYNMRIAKIKVRTDKLLIL